MSTENCCIQAAQIYHHMKKKKSLLQGLYLQQFKKRKGRVYQRSGVISDKVISSYSKDLFSVKL